jgi:hypothetical protein
VTATNAIGTASSTASIVVAETVLADPMDVALDGIEYEDYSDTSTITLEVSPADDVDFVTSKIASGQWNSNFYIPKSGIDTLNGENVLTTPTAGNVGARFFGPATLLNADPLGEFQFYCLYNTSQTTQQFLFTHGTADTNMGLLITPSHLKLQARFGFVNTSVQIDKPAVDTWTLVVGSYDGANMRLANEIDSGSVAITGNLNLQGSTTVRRFSSASNERFQGKAAFFWWGDRLHTAEEQTSMKAFFNAKYGL